MLARQARPQASAQLADESVSIRAIEAIDLVAAQLDEPYVLFVFGGAHVLETRLALGRNAVSLLTAGV